MTHSEDQGQRYHQVKNQLLYLTIGMDVVLLVLWVTTGLSVWLAQMAQRFFPSVWMINAVYLAGFQLAFSAVHFPFDFFLDYYWEHRFGLSRQSLSQWLKDVAKKFLLSFVFILVFVEAVYFFLRHFAPVWWVLAAGFWLLASLFLARILPQVIIPLFYKYIEIENPSLKERLMSLFRKCAVPLQDIYAINMSEKTKKANAFICGIGRSRRVVLSDTLINNFSEEQIETVVAHELGHHKKKHLLKLIAVNALLTFVAFFVVHHVLSWGLGRWGNIPLADIAGFPLLVLTLLLFGFVTTPLSNAISRAFEIEADRFSMQLTQEKEHFISMLQKIGELNLAEVAPHWFNEMMFHDHPPLEKRIKLAQGYDYSHDRNR